MGYVLDLREIDPTEVAAVGGKGALLGEPSRIEGIAVPPGFHELRDLVNTHRSDQQLIRRRKDAFLAHQTLTPPRVITSDGEVISGTYRRDDIPGALIGLPVSVGTSEGRARVIQDIAHGDIEAGDILVTTYTTPAGHPSSSRSTAW